MPSLDSLIAEWMEHLFIQRGRQARGVEQYAKIVRSFFAWTGVDGLPTLSPAAISRNIITEWQKALFYDMGNISNRSRASKLSAARSFFAWLKYAGYRADDPTKGIPSPRIQPALPQKFSTEELRLLFAAPAKDNAMGIRDAAMLKTMYAAGPRVSELINLDISHVQDTGGYIRLQIINGKGGKDRTITMQRNPSRALRDWLLLRREIESDCDAIFIRLKKGGHQGKSDRLTDRSAQNVLKKYSRMVGIGDAEVFAHKMRSTFITDLYDSGHDKCPRCGCGVRNYDIFEIMLLAGHEDPKTTMGYTAISDRRLRKIAIPDRRFKEIEEG